MSTETRLKPCPFCGGAAKEFERFNANVITCRRCGVKVRQSEMGEGDAAVRWNQRATPVAAHPDLTQQTLDDVKAGIPARDAEIEALRTEIEALKASAEPVAWVRRHSDGALTAEFLEHAVIEQVRKNSGAWVPLYTAPIAAHAQQPVSGAAGLQADGALVADERDLVALAVKHHIRFPRNRDLIAFIDEARASLAIAQPATQPQPSGNSGELPATQTQGMTLGQRIAHVGGRENAQGYVEFGSPMAVHALIQQVLRDFHQQGRVSLAPAQQDADKVDAERYRAYRAAIVAEDGAFLGRAESYLSSLGLRAEVLPTEDQIDAAMDAARKEVQP